MAAGEALKTWFDPVVRKLKREWHQDMTPEQMIELCQKLTKTRDNYRKKHQIKGQMMTCHSCGEKHAYIPRPVSITGMLYSLRKEKCIDEPQSIEIEKEWKRFQRKHKLTSNGEPKQVMVNGSI